MPTYRPLPPGHAPRRRRRGGFNAPKAPVEESGRGDGAVATLQAQEIALPRSLTVKDMADLLRVDPIYIMKSLIRRGVMATVNQGIDFPVASAVAADLGFAAIQAGEEEGNGTGGAAARALPDEPKEGQPRLPRPPIVTVMGHVDHGKTSILDSIRRSNVAAGEAGGITQHMGAYQVEVGGRTITFIDTPGHEAFTAMRARGAQATDVVVLVVAADDGVMPQTREALSHARAAGVPIIVAVNKIDRPDANVDRVKQQLGEEGLVLEEWGGETIVAPVSARTGEGIAAILESILLVAELAELTADAEADAKGVVLEAELDRARGPMATVLVQDGTLHLGDGLAAGIASGRIKAMLDDRGQLVQEVGPGTPARVLGFDSLPEVGETFRVVADERTARNLAEERRLEREGAGLSASGARLERAFSEAQSGGSKSLKLVVKTDVQGTMQPIRTCIERLDSSQLRVNLLHTATGSITESDVMLAIASKAIILGFNVRTEPGARRLADQEGVEIRHYDVIYRLVEDMEKAAAGLLEPEMVETVEGHVEVRQLFRVGRTNVVAGVFVRDGKVSRSSQVRVMRGSATITTARVSSLRRFKDDVRDVAAGFECGVSLEGFHAFEEGDTLEFFRIERASAV